MPSLARQLELLKLLDSFDRLNEGPMKRPEWTTLPWTLNDGQVKGNAWTEFTSLGGGPDGAYWNPTKWGNQAIIGGPVQGSFAEGKYIALWAATDPANHNGYRLVLTSAETTAGPGKHTWRLEKITKGAATLLESGELVGLRGDKIALVVLDGVVSFWRQLDAEGNWVEVTSRPDVTYVNGYVGMESRSPETHTLANVWGGEVETSVEPEPEPEPEPEQVAPTARQGYPDWQRLTLRLTQPLYWHKAIGFGESLTLGPFFVGSVPAVDVWIRQVEGEAAYKLTFNWAADKAISAPFISDTYRVGPSGGSLRSRLACQGAWLEIGITRLSNVAAAKWDVLIVPSDVLPAEPRFGNPLLVASTAQAVAAAATAHLTSARTVWGPAQLEWSVGATPALLVVEELNEKGEWVTFMRYPTARWGATVAQRIVLPPTPVRLSTTNESAGETTYDLALGLA